MLWKIGIGHNVYYALSTQAKYVRIIWKKQEEGCRGLWCCPTMKLPRPVDYGELDEDEDTKPEDAYSMVRAAGLTTSERETWIGKVLEE